LLEKKLKELESYKWGRKGREGYVDRMKKCRVTHDPQILRKWS